MNAALKVGAGAVAGAVAAKYVKGYITPHTTFLGSYNDVVIEALITAAVAVAASKVL